MFCQCAHATQRWRRCQVATWCRSRRSTCGARCPHVRGRCCSGDVTRLGDIHRPRCDSASEMLFQLILGSVCWTAGRRGPNPNGTYLGRRAPRQTLTYSRNRKVSRRTPSERMAWPVAQVDALHWLAHAFAFSVRMRRPVQGATWFSVDQHHHPQLSIVGGVPNLAALAGRSASRVRG